MCYISSKSGLNPLRGCTMFDSLHVKDRHMAIFKGYACCYLGLFDYNNMFDK